MTAQTVLEPELRALLETYLTDKEITRVAQAATYAQHAHEGVYRKEDGAPYYTHPLAVATYLARKQKDVVTLVSAFLHDVVEDTETTSEEIAHLFGEDVAFIVEALTKKVNTNGQTCSLTTHQKVSTATRVDERVLMIKLADRWHNTQTLSCHHNQVKELAKLNDTEPYLALGREMQLLDQVAELEAVMAREYHRLGRN